MDKRIVILVELLQNNKVLPRLLSFAKARFPDWKITVVNISNKTDNNVGLVSNGQKQHITEEITLDTLINIIKSSNLIIGRSNPIIDETLPYLAGKTRSISLNRCSNIMFNADSDCFSIFKDVYGSRIKTTTEISALNTVFISFENLEYESKEKMTKDDIEYYTIYNETIFGGNYENTNEILSTDKKVDLKDAAIVVSGGRGIKDKEDFELLKLLADKLGGALGASRAIVDADFIGEESQVGQTGKTICPDYYMAFGISGTTQHVAGMRNSRTIIAVNKDPDALIFKFADYGIVHDYKDIVLNLIDKLNSK